MRLRLTSAHAAYGARQVRQDLATGSRHRQAPVLGGPHRATLPGSVTLSDRERQGERSPSRRYGRQLRLGVAASTASRTGRYAHQNAGTCERWLSPRLGAMRRRVRVRDPEDSPGQGGRPPANSGGPAALAGHRGRVPRQRLGYLLHRPRPARANAEATAPLITPAAVDHRSLVNPAAFRLLVPCLPGRSPAPALIGVHERGPPKSTARKHYARKHGQGGTGGFRRSHARHLAGELLLLPNAGSGRGPGTVPCSCAARSLFRPPRWPRAARSAQSSSLPCSSLLTDRLSGRISNIAVRPPAPNRTNALIPAQHQP